MSSHKASHKRVLILGGYNPFGSRIAEMLASEDNIKLVIAGHDRYKAELVANRLQQQFPDATVESLRLDHNSDSLPAQLHRLDLQLLIHCAGPFGNQDDNQGNSQDGDSEGQDYQVANACIDQGIDYLDIANATNFVCGISTLNQKATEAGSTVISGAGTLPALSSAIIQALGNYFEQIDAIEINFSPAHRIREGLTAVRPKFKLLGRAFSLTRNGGKFATYSGAEPRKIDIGHPVGRRWVCNFDAPDLRLAPSQYPSVKNLRFGTGVQPRPLQLGLSMCANLVRALAPTGVPAPRTWISRMGHWLVTNWPGGSPNGGLQVVMKGVVKGGIDTAENGHTSQAQCQVLGLNGDGPWVPAAPAAAMARKLLRKHPNKPGARPCWQLLSLEEILTELTPYSIVTSLEIPREELTST